jgi:hypothetical protein
MIGAIRQSFEAEDVTFTLGLFERTPDVPTVVPCSVHVMEVAASEPLEFADEICNAIATAADTLYIAHMPILSLAGLSHHEAESSEPADLAATLVKLAEVP